MGGCTVNGIMLQCRQSMCLSPCCCCSWVSHCLFVMAALYPVGSCSALCNTDRAAVCQPSFSTMLACFLFVFGCAGVRSLFCQAKARMDGQITQQPCLQYSNPSVCLSVRLSIYRTIHLSNLFCSFVLCLCLSSCLSIYLSIYRTIQLFLVCPTVFDQSVCQGHFKSGVVGSIIPT